MEKLRLSQQNLNLLESCPRKFQQTYLDGLVLPTSWEQEKNTAWGRRFHLLMQQRELGLSIEPFMAEDKELNQCFLGLETAAPELFNTMAGEGRFRESEHYRTLGFGDYLLVAIYDLLITDKNKAQVIDWKTHHRLIPQPVLAKDWQTRLYLYLLVETSDYSPEQVSMDYWFVRLEGNRKPEKITFFYDCHQHQKTQQDLIKLCDRLSDYLYGYQQGEEFPQVEPGVKLCKSCVFAQRCDRYSETNQGRMVEPILPQRLWNLDEIAEIPM